VTRAARLLGVSRDTVRYRLQRYGITRPRLDNPSALASQLLPRTGARRSPSHREVPLNELAVPSAPTLAEQGEGKNAQETAVPQDVAHNTVTRPNIPTTMTAWEQKTVAVLVLEVTWPEAARRESSSYEPWTEMACWEEAVVDKVRGFGGDLLQRTPALLTWVFGLPRRWSNYPSGQCIVRWPSGRWRWQPRSRRCRPVLRCVWRCTWVLCKWMLRLPSRWRGTGRRDTGAAYKAAGTGSIREILVSPEVGRLVEAGWRWRRGSCLYPGKTPRVRLGMPSWG
jgi:hypothetical protein